MFVYIQLIQFFSNQTNFFTMDMPGKLVKNVAKTILESIVFKTIADIPKQLIACVMAGSSHFEAFVKISINAKA